MPIGVRVLADLILVVHVCIAGFITAGFVLIPLGAAAGWRWVRHRRLRLLHAGAIAFVALESLAGIACPLTVWENMLRGGTSGEAGFIGHWLGRLLYWDFPPALFTLLYVALALLAAWLWRRIPPQAP
ncbi:MAG: DUF2784 domain-containing protein [Burkholderiales bacterium]|uniref:DUF2784 domain-containing protein n=1 Tax=Candidatus Desulfobacillus denitrificans TaxID=2608985 RepID=A0A809R1R8_9PROT|nr:DUF2784 family protein [Rhodocyclaceae bacterium]MCZ2173700.1 DUF2784 domain-containing protein [Burkholderiales bacterium]BBO21570.1 conserved hypothetical protein [Candidatus Desulfobacillus denitrificans]GIK46405.1 MAG: hypothetical protein BroJett012_23080 [Betaproteobacteria bacterium]GJQ55940.1 MAG: hypothetical protein HKUEN07_25090 [Rhodocyclaceae bacterium]